MASEQNLSDAPSSTNQGRVAQPQAAEVRAELERRLLPEPRRTEYGGGESLNLVDGVFCVDGLKMSVQASHGHYCSPRDSKGPWREVEVGFPSRRIEAFMPFIDGGEDTEPTDTVYAYVPIELVVGAIVAAGGFAEAVQS